MTARGTNCFCAAYRFPHRAGGGQCPANPFKPQDICTRCGMAANEVTRDFGIGAYEFWGSREVHRDVRTVSECCEDDLRENTGAYLGAFARRTTTTGVSK